MEDSSISKVQTKKQVGSSLLNIVKGFVSRLPWTSDLVIVEEREDWIRKLNSIKENERNQLMDLLSDHGVLRELLWLHLTNLLREQEERDFQIVLLQILLRDLVVSDPIQ